MRKPAFDVVATVIAAWGCGGTPAHAPAAPGSEPETGTEPKATVEDVAANSAAEVATTEPEPAQPAQPTEPVLGLLEIPDFGEAVVSVPGDLSEPRPLLVMAHGAGGGPDWHCESWRQILHNSSFVLCPRGDAINRRDERYGYYYKNHLALEKEFSAAVHAIVDQFGDRIDLQHAIYAGYSQGATMGSLMIPAHGARFSRLVLIEGGFSEWTVKSARTYKEAGGTRVLFACGTRHCHRKARRSAAHLERAGIQTRVEFAEGAGHTPAGKVRDSVIAALGWLMEGDVRFDHISDYAGAAN